jgi:hypothetical protein
MIDDDELAQLYFADHISEPAALHATALGQLTDAQWQDLEDDLIRDLSEFGSNLGKSLPAPDAAGWGVPDWQDASSYPKRGDLALPAWRWEFLRRNHGYRTDFLRPDTDFGVFSQEWYFQKKI